MIDWIILLGQVLLLAYFLWQLNEARKRRNLFDVLTFGILLLAYAIVFSAHGLIEAQPDQVIVDVHFTQDSGV